MVGQHKTERWVNMEQNLHKAIIDNGSAERYFILYFDILNRGNYSLQSVKATIYDNWGISMLKLGVKHFRDGLSSGISRPAPHEIDNFNPVNHFDNIGIITKNLDYPLYTTTFCPRLSNLDNPIYVVEIKSYTSSLLYFIHLKVIDDKIKLEPGEMLFDGAKIDYKRYLKFNE
jgi:hypothetical protein